MPTSRPHYTTTILTYAGLGWRWSHTTLARLLRNLSCLKCIFSERNCLRDHLGHADSHMTQVAAAWHSVQIWGAGIHDFTWAFLAPWDSMGFPTLNSCHPKSAPRGVQSSGSRKLRLAQAVLVMYCCSCRHFRLGAIE
jgi:hypothetical protein